MTEERYQKLKKVLAHRREDLTLVLENVEDPHNIAAVLRTCESVGLQDVYIVTTDMPKHKKFGKEIGFRSSSSAAKWLTIHEYTSVEECVKVLREKYKKLYTTALGVDAVSLYETNLTESVALVFGNERFGVSGAMQSMSDGNFIIPQVGIIQSLNVSVACAVTLYEAFRQKMQAGHYNSTSLSPERLAMLENEWGLNSFEQIEER